MPSNTQDFEGPYDAHGARVTDENTLRILNSNQGVRNSIPKEDFFSMMNKVFQEVADNLTAHCGPYSRSALVVSPSGGKYETNTFTKDGRNIVAAMNFVSPIEEIIKEMLLYIGSRVDNKAGDGTTSSMYIASRFFSLMSEAYKDKTVNSRQFALAYKKFEKILLDSLEHQKITLDQLYQDLELSKDGKDVARKKAQKLVGAIAAIQTLASSGGDTELAKCMYDIYCQSPKGTWDYVAIYHQKWESSAKYAVEFDPYDHWLTANILTPGMLNENLYSEYKDNVDILVLPQEVPGGGVLADEVETYLQSIHNDERDRTLVIFCRSIDAKILRIIQNHNASNAHFKICVFEHLDEFSVTSVSMGLIGLSLSGGKDPFMVGKTGVGHLDESYVLKDVEVHYKNHKLYVNKLFTKWVEDEDDPCHPFYRDPDKFKPFTYFLKSLQNRVEKLKDDINQTQYKNEIDQLQNEISRMCFPRRPYLLVGGSSHDHAEAVDVIRDCAGAINSALTDGFICGSSMALLRAIGYMNIVTNADGYNADIMEMRHMAMRAVAELIGITIYGHAVELPENWTSLETVDILKCLFDWYHCNKDRLVSHVLFTEDFYKYFTDSEYGVDRVCTDYHKYEYVNILNFTENSGRFGHYGYMDCGDHLMQLIEDDSDIDKYLVDYAKAYPIIQPAKVFEQLLARIGELMIKLITTEEVIVPGAVYIPKE